MVRGYAGTRIILYVQLHPQKVLPAYPKSESVYLFFKRGHEIGIHKNFMKFSFPISPIVNLVKCQIEATVFMSIVAFSQ